MKKQIFAVLDTTAGVYDQPFFMPNKAVAVRAFTEAVKKPESQMNKYPKDYKLVCLGTYNDETGEIKGTVPEQIMSADSIVEPNTELLKELKWIENK